MSPRPNGWHRAPALRTGRLSRTDRRRRMRVDCSRCRLPKHVLCRKIPHSSAGTLMHQQLLPTWWHCVSTSMHSILRRNSKAGEGGRWQVAWQFASCCMQSVWLISSKVHPQASCTFSFCLLRARADAELQARGRHVAGRQDGDRRYVPNFFLK